MPIFSILSRNQLIFADILCTSRWGVYSILPEYKLVCVSFTRSLKYRLISKSASYIYIWQPSSDIIGVCDRRKVIFRYFRHNQCSQFYRYQDSVIVFWRKKFSHETNILYSQDMNLISKTNNFFRPKKYNFLFFNFHVCKN